MKGAARHILLAGLALLVLPQAPRAHQSLTPNYHERLLACLDQEPLRNAAELFLACVDDTEVCADSAGRHVQCVAPGHHELANWLFVINRLTPAVRALAEEAGNAEAFDAAQRAAAELGQRECSYFRHPVFGDLEEAICHRDWAARQAIDLFLLLRKARR